jgi:hypothetical protein
MQKEGRRIFRQPTKLDEIMDCSMRRGFLHLLSNRARMTEIWQRTVGPKVAPNTTILSFELGRLTVSVKGPAYYERYRYDVGKWLKRLNIEYGDEVVTEIVLQVGG